VSIRKRIAETIGFTTGGQIISHHHNIAVGFAVLEESAVERL
jgi:hypothetical protein